MQFCYITMTFICFRTKINTPVCLRWVVESIIHFSDSPGSASYVKFMRSFDSKQTRQNHHHPTRNPHPATSVHQPGRHAMIVRGKRRPTRSTCTVAAGTAITSYSSLSKSRSRTSGGKVLKRPQNLPRIAAVNAGESSVTPSPAAP